MIGSALHSTDQDIALDCFGDFRKGVAVQHGVCGDVEFEQFHVSAGKRLDLDSGGELEQAGGLQSSRILRINGQGQSQLLAYKAYFTVVDGISHAGDGTAVTGLFGDQTAQEVEFVGIRGRDHKIRLLDTQLLLHRVAAAVADDSHDITAAGYFVDHLLVSVDDTDVMSFFAELPGKGRAHFAAADHYDFHAVSSLMPMFYLLTRRISPGQACASSESRMSSPG